MTLLPQSAGAHSSPPVTADSLTINPFMAARVVIAGSRVAAIEVCCFAPYQQPRRFQFTADSGSLCGIMSALLKDPGALQRVPSTALVLLRQAGIVIERSAEATMTISQPMVVTQSATEHPIDVGLALARHVAPLEWQQVLNSLDAGAEDPTPADADRFRREGYVVIDRLLSADLSTALARYYRRLDSLGLLSTGDPLSRQRRSIRRDPGGRAILARCQRGIAALCGHAVTPTYNYAAIYADGASLPMHRDRSLCEYTLSLLLDYDSLPVGQTSPWPLLVEPGEGAAAIELRARVGAGIAFRGRQLLHGRPALPPTASCCVLMCHYVDSAPASAGYPAVDSEP